MTPRVLLGRRLNCKFRVQQEGYQRLQVSQHTGELSRRHLETLWKRVFKIYMFQDPGRVPSNLNVQYRQARKNYCFAESQVTGQEFPRGFLRRNWVMQMNGAVVRVWSVKIEPNFRIYLKRCIWWPAASTKWRIEISLDAPQATVNIFRYLHILRIRRKMSHVPLQDSHKCHFNIHGGEQNRTLPLTDLSFFWFVFDSQNKQTPTLPNAKLSSRFEPCSLRLGMRHKKYCKNATVI